MTHEWLYNQFKNKRFQQTLVQQAEMERINNLSEPKINTNSGCILLKRTLQKMDQFPDHSIVNLQTSVTILRQVGILKVLTSVLDANQKLREAEDKGKGCERLRQQAEFLYALWDLLEEEEVQGKEIKYVVEVLLTKKKNQCRILLSELFTFEQKIESLIRAWFCLYQSQQYYKYTGKSIDKASKQNKQNRQNNFNKSYGRLDKSAELGSPIQNNRVFGGTANEFCGNEFSYTCQLSLDQQKDLVSRLYDNQKYREREEMKKEREQQKQAQALQQCTFKPNLIQRSRCKSVNSYNKDIRGYDKAVQRIKAGNQKTKVSKEMRDYKPVGQNYDRLKQKGINPPKFLNRKKKEQQKLLFTISFDLGRYKTNVKIRESDTQDSVAEKICKIYSLKKEYFDQIREIVRSQLSAYYQDVQKQEYERFEGQELF